MLNNLPSRIAKQFEKLSNNINKDLNMCHKATQTPTWPRIHMRKEL